jgi:class 3 adenylate cyclase/TolB-like protein
MSEFENELSLRTTTTTVMFADVADSTRLVQRDERGAVERMRRLLITGAGAVVPQVGGRVIQRTGDGLLLEFPDPSKAAKCAFKLHELAAAQSAGLSELDRIYLRIGIHSAEVLRDEAALYGHGVNFTARIASLARPGETLVSAAARDHLVQDLDGSLEDTCGEDFYQRVKRTVDRIGEWSTPILEDMGQHYAKYIDHPFRLFRLREEAPAGAPGDLIPVTPLTPRLAILPFEPYVGVDSALNVGDVVTDQLIATLSRSPSITVISGLSTQAVRGRGLSIETSATRLGANYVLSGRFYTDGDKVHFLSELVCVDSKDVLWTERVSGSVHETLIPDSDLIMRIAKGVAEALFQTEGRGSHTKPLPSLSSHTLYLTAVSLMHRFSRANFDRSREMLDTLHERTPRHPWPLAWLARWHMLSVLQGWSNDLPHDRAQAMAYAERALNLDPGSPLALTMLGCAWRSVRKDLDQAQLFFDKALALNPSEGLAWLFKGTIHGLQGEGEAAIEATDHALALSPLDPMRAYYESLSATAAAGGGQYDRAIELARCSLTTNATHASSYRILAISLAMQERWPEARETIRKLLWLAPQSSVQDFLERAGRRSRNNEVFAEALIKAGLPEKRGAGSSSDRFFQ